MGEGIAGPKCECAGEMAEEQKGRVPEVQLCSAGTFKGSGGMASRYLFPRAPFCSLLVIPHRGTIGTRLPDPRPSFTTSPPSLQQEEEQCFPNPTVPSLLDLPSRTPYTQPLDGSGLRCRP